MCSINTFVDLKVQRAWNRTGCLGNC